MTWRNLVPILLSLYYLPLFGWAAENYKPGDKLYVAPTTGINIRQLPDKTGPILTQIPYNTVVTVMTDSLTSKPFQVAVSDFNSGKLILKGKWVKVGIGKLTGYVFDGMLSTLKGLPVNNMEEEAHYAALFGKPTHKVVKKTTVLEGHKEDYETEFTYHPRGVKIESTFLDGCYDITYTFNTSFNQAYWLVQRMVLDGDAMQDMKIKKLKNQTVFRFASCT